MGKAGLISVFDETGFAESQDKLFDHVTWHRVGSYTEVSGKASWTGHCLNTDPTGDQYMSDIESDGTYDSNAESHAAKGRFVSAQESSPASPEPGPTSTTNAATRCRRIVPM
jgi:hypothetical protein